LDTLNLPGLRDRLHSHLKEFSGVSVNLTPIRACKVSSVDLNKNWFLLDFLSTFVACLPNNQLEI